VTGTHFDVHTKKPFRKRAASDQRLHDSVYLFINFFPRRLLVLKNSEVELHSYTALPCKRFQTVKKKKTTTTIIFTWVPPAGSFSPCFSPIPPLAPQRATLFLLVRTEIVQ